MNEPNEAVQRLPPSGDAAPREYGIGVLRGAIAAVPYVGTLLNEMIFDARSRLKQKRLEQFFSEVAADVEKLKEERIDKGYVNSDAFSDLVEEICTRVARTDSEARRKHFKDVLVRSMTTPPPPDLTPMFLDVLAEISEAEIVVLGNLCHATKWLRDKRAQGQKADIKAFDFNAPELLGLPVQQFRLALQALIRKGLAHDDTGGRLGPIEYNAIVLGTDLGIEFLNWLRRVDD